MRYNLIGLSIIALIWTTGIAVSQTPVSPVLKPLEGGTGAVNPTCNSVADATGMFSPSTTYNYLAPVGAPTLTVCPTIYAYNAMPPLVSLFGSGRVKDTEGNLRGPIYVQSSTKPVKFSNYTDNHKFVWNADYSKVPIAIESITNKGAYGPGPGSNLYEFEKQQSAVYLNCYSEAGRNDQAGKGSNRSGAGCQWIDFNNNGIGSDGTGTDSGGDMVATYILGVVSGHHTGSTSFLANPEIGGFGGQFTTLTDGTWVEPIGDLTVVDKGFDVASLSVMNNFRNNAKGDLNTNHVGWLSHSVGTKPMDAFYMGSGSAATGIVLTQMKTPDQTLAAEPILVSGGSGYAVGQTVQMATAGYTCDQWPTLKIRHVDGSGAIIEVAPFTDPAFGLDRRGMCSVFPVATDTVALIYSPVNATLPASGSGATANFTFAPSAAIALPPDAGIAFDSYCDTGVYATCFPSTVYNGKAWIGFDSTVGGLNFTDNGVSTLQIVGQTATVPGGAKFSLLGSMNARLRVVSGAVTTDNMDTLGGNTDNTIVIRSTTAATFAEHLTACNSFTQGRIIVIKDGSNDAATAININAVTSTVEGVATFSLPLKTAARFQCDSAATDWVKIN